MRAGRKTAIASVRHNRANIVLTGLPRSGTTLACRLLNLLPDTVALHEPIAPGRFAGLADEQAVLDAVESYFRRMRRMIRNQGAAVSKQAGGEIPVDAYEQTRFGKEPRPHSAEKGTGKGKIVIDKDLKKGFLLVIKQPALFSALLPVLEKRFPCYAIVRNPLAVLASWNSVDHVVREGHSRGAELYDEVLRRELASIEDRATRQLRLVSWWYERFSTTLDPENIIRYEDIVNSGGAALSAVTPAAEALRERLWSRNRNPLYDREDTLRLGERLLASKGAYWGLYTRESVEALLAIS